MGEKEKIKCRVSQKEKKRPLTEDSYFTTNHAFRSIEVKATYQKAREL